MISFLMFVVIVFGGLGYMIYRVGKLAAAYPATSLKAASWIKQALGK